jgi:SAM-dependent methyltransferase
MVHALEEIHRLLKPNGYLIEIHPILDTPLVKVHNESIVLFVGPYPGYDYEEDLRQAENAIQQIVQRGLFVIERSIEFKFLTYGSSITELQDLWGEPAEAREAELYAQVEEVMQAAGQGAKVALHEKARISRLIPI